MIETFCDFCGRSSKVARYMAHSPMRRIGLVRREVHMCIHCAGGFWGAMIDDYRKRRSGLNNHYWRLLQDFRERMGEETAE